MALVNYQAEDVFTWQHNAQRASEYSALCCGGAKGQTGGRDLQLRKGSCRHEPGVKHEHAHALSSRTPQSTKYRRQPSGLGPSSSFKLHDAAFVFAASP